MEKLMTSLLSVCWTDGLLRMIVVIVIVFLLIIVFWCLLIFYNKLTLQFLYCVIGAAGWRHRRGCCGGGRRRSGGEGRERGWRWRGWENLNVYENESESMRAWEWVEASRLGFNAKGECGRMVPCYYLLFVYWIINNDMTSIWLRVKLLGLITWYSVWYVIT